VAAGPTTRKPTEESEVMGLFLGLGGVHFDGGRMRCRCPSFPRRETLGSGYFKKETKERIAVFFSEKIPVISSRFPKEKRNFICVILRHPEHE